MMGQEIPQNVMVMFKEGNGVIEAKVIVKDPVVEDGVPMGNQIQLLCHSPHQLPIHCHPALQWRQLRLQLSLLDQLPLLNHPHLKLPIQQMRQMRKKVDIVTGVRSFS